MGCIDKAGQYCVDMAKPARDMDIQRNPPLSHEAPVALLIANYSASKSHIDRNISDVDARLTDHKETKGKENANTDNISAKIIQRINGFENGREKGREIEELGTDVRKLPVLIQDEDQKDVAMDAKKEKTYACR